MKETQLRQSYTFNGDTYLLSTRGLQIKPKRKSAQETMTPWRSIDPLYEIRQQFPLTSLFGIIGCLIPLGFAIYGAFNGMLSGERFVPLIILLIATFGYFSAYAEKKIHKLIFYNSDKPGHAVSINLTKRNYQQAIAFRDEIVDRIHHRKLTLDESEDILKGAGILTQAEGEQLMIRIAEYKLKSEAEAGRSDVISFRKEPEHED